MEQENFPHPLKTVVSGSFRKNMKDVAFAIQQFKKSGVEVLAPQTSDIVNPGGEFVFLRTDKQREPYKLEIAFLRSIRRADFLYLANNNGYLGQSVATETGYAILKDKPVLIAEDIRIFGEGISERVQRLLKETPMGVLPITDISPDRIHHFLTHQGRKVIPDERHALWKPVRKLLSDLRSLYPRG